jgi:hypothetical protein
MGQAACRVPEGELMESVQRSLGNIEGKLDMLIDLHQANDKRLAAVEKKVWYGSGIAFVLALIASKLQFPIFRP